MASWWTEKTTQEQTLTCMLSGRHATPSSVRLRWGDHIFTSPSFWMHAGLRNDHKALMKTIEQQLYQLHAEARERGVVSQPDSGRQDKNQQMNTFATVVSVVDRSPAADSVRDTRLTNFNRSIFSHRVYALVISSCSLVQSVVTILLDCRT